MLVNFERVKNPFPTVAEVKDRHVQHQHRIVRSPLPALENSSPVVAGRRRPPFILNFEFIRLFFSLTGGLPQAHGAERVRGQIAINPQAVAALVARNRMSRLRANDTVDCSTIITLARESFLRGSDG